MKRCCRLSIVPLVTAILLAVNLRARADAIAVSQVSFGGSGSAFGLSVNPDGGSGQFSQNALASVFAQSGMMTQTNFGTTPSIFTSDGLSQGFASASVPPSYGMSAMAGSSNAILGNINGSENAKGTILIWDDSFMIKGAPGGTVQVEFNLDFSQALSVYTDSYGQSAKAQTTLSLNLSGGGYNDTQLLFSAWNLSVGPNQSESANFSDITADGIGTLGLALQYNQPYTLSLEVDTETSVINVPEPSDVPEPGVGALAVVATLAGFLCRRKRNSRPSSSDGQALV